MNQNQRSRNKSFHSRKLIFDNDAKNYSVGERIVLSKDDTGTIGYAHKGKCEF